MTLNFSFDRLDWDCSLTYVVGTGYRFSVNGELVNNFPKILEPNIEPDPVAFSPTIRYDGNAVK